MRIKFLGPIERVTGSCYWLQDDNHTVQFLVDCGMVQDEPDADEWNSGRAFPFEPAKLDFVLLTHCHIDHSGLLPLLVKKGFSGTVYCTKATEELTRIALLDAARHSGHLYGKAEVDALRFHERGKGVFDVIHPLKHNLFFCMYRTSHVLGGVSIKVLWGPLDEGQKSIIFSGDLGENQENMEHQPLLRHRMNDKYVADYAVVESTYGCRIRPPEEKCRERRLAQLSDTLEKAILERQGPLIIPAFAIDRTQALMFDIHEVIRCDPRFEDIPKYLHAGMASKVNEVYAEHLPRKQETATGKLRHLWLNKRLFEWLGLDRNDPLHEKAVEQYLQLIFGKSRPKLSSEEFHCLQELIPGARRGWTRVKPRATAPLDKPAIILTGGGMCEGGPVLEYLEQLLQRPEATLLLAGFVATSTLGGSLLRLSRIGLQDRVRLRDTLSWNTRDSSVILPESNVLASIECFRGYSGHADQVGLVDWIYSEFEGQRHPVAGTIFITHGLEQARIELENAITRRGKELETQGSAQQSSAPQVIRPGRDHPWYDLNRGEWLTDTVPDEITRLRLENEELRRSLAARE